MSLVSARGQWGLAGADAARGRGAVKGHEGRCTFKEIVSELRVRSGTQATILL